MVSFDLSLSANIKKLFEILAFHRSFILLCTSCARGFDLERKDNKTVNTAKKTPHHDRKSKRNFWILFLSERYFFGCFLSIEREVETSFRSVVFLGDRSKKKRLNVKTYSWNELLLSLVGSHYMEPEFDGQNRKNIKIVIARRVNGDFWWNSKNTKTEHFQKRTIQMGPCVGPPNTPTFYCPQPNDIIFVIVDKTIITYHSGDFWRYFLTQRREIFQVSVYNLQRKRNLKKF